jgi:hypothetical protein
MRKTLPMPRVGLFNADAAGLGNTIEASLRSQIPCCTRTSKTEFISLLLRGRRKFTLINSKNAN